ncbi:MAG: nicotinate-nicotinamide nucleotide adenylyltransferase [Polyangiaceae bacterium]
MSTLGAMRVGVYGGSFDPPHVAHVLLAAYALSVGGFDRVLVVPVFAHTFNKELLPFEQRVELCELGFRDLSRVTVSRIEQSLPVPSRTLTTIEALQREYAGAELRLLVGADILADVSKWHTFDQVTAKAPLFVVGRAGHESVNSSGFSLPPISSTRVRELLMRRQEPDAARELSEIVPQAVLERIDRSGLYRPT